LSQVYIVRGSYIGHLMYADDSLSAPISLQGVPKMAQIFVRLNFIKY